MSGPFAPMQDTELTRLIDSLVAQGWFVGERFIDDRLCRSLHDELMHLANQDALSAAGIGRGREHHVRRDIRRDEIRWLTQESPAQQTYLVLMSELQHALNRALFLGLFEFEAHFAHYPPGAFYKTHVDSFQGRANRVISTVLYLNPDWPADGGGDMIIYDPATPEHAVARIAPQAGTFACFLSETIPHEVRPTRLTRSSIAGWFRRNASLGGIVDPAR